MGDVEEQTVWKPVEYSVSIVMERELYYILKIIFAFNSFITYVKRCSELECMWRSGLSTFLHIKYKLSQDSYLFFLIMFCVWSNLVVCYQDRK